MRSYEILGQASQSSRRTIADALAVLEAEAAFGEDDTAQIRIGHLQLPSGETVGLVLVVFDMPCTDKGYAVPLPTATQLYADHGSSRRVLFDVGLFDEAVADGKGNVFLTTGETLRAVEVVPARLPLKPTDLDWRIVHATVECVEKKQSCYRGLRSSLKEEDLPIAFMVPDIDILDFTKMRDLVVPSLDSIAAQLAERIRRERAPSPQKIADTLADFGMRFPRFKGASVRHRFAAN